jgi:hypothetical protein
MKKLLSIIGVAALLATSSQAQTIPMPSPELKAAAISFAQNVEATRTVTLALYPTYAPGISTAKWGYGAALICPASAITALESNGIAQHTFGGLRVDRIGGGFYASTVAVGMKGDFQLWGHNFTIFGESGVNIPMSGAGGNNLNLGAMVGSGINTHIYSFGKADDSGSQPFSLDAFVCAEKWTQFSGYVLHAGPTLTWKF